MDQRLRQLLAAGATIVGACIAAGSAQAAAPIGAYTTTGAFSFASAPRLHPPKLHTDAPPVRSRLAPGYFLVTNFKNLTLAQPMVGQGGPLILDSHLQPVWFYPVDVNEVAGNLRLQTYLGKPALSWWSGVITNTGATTSGHFTLVDQHYRTIAKLTGQDGWVLSLHDLVVSGHNAWVTAYKTMPLDLTPYGGQANGLLEDSAVQEYDLRTGKLLYTWDALQHISLKDSETHAPPVAGVPWDAYHVNSIQLVGTGSFLTSMRNTWAGYLVDIRSGNINWTAGGKKSSFTGLDAGSAHFEWQHDIELHAGNVLSLFDDHCCAIVGPGKFAPATGPTRGLVLKLDTIHHTAAFQTQYSRGANFHAAFLGNTQLLPNGNVVEGWGSKPFFSEYSRSGKLLLDVIFPTPNVNYRAYVVPWVGTPFFAPSGAVRGKSGRAIVYASWDGATEVVGWRVLGGRDAKHLTVVGLAPKVAFETAVRLRHTYRRYKVQALDRKGHVLGSSGIFPKPQSASSGPGFY